MTTSPFAFPVEPSGSQPSGAESLLAEHGAFLTALSRALVRDTGVADDLAQETLVAALGRGGSADRPWLATVLRRKAANRFRAETRRSQRERVAARPEAANETAMESAERMETIERLFRKVRGLDEPLREAILGRFYRGLSYVELGRECGVPASTVQSRVQRGIETLRHQLDDGGGARGRAAWMAAIGGFAGLEPFEAGAQAGAQAGAAGHVGSLSASAKAWAGAAGVFVLGAVGLVAHGAWGDSRQADAERPGAELGLAAANDPGAMDSRPGTGPVLAGLTASDVAQAGARRKGTAPAERRAIVSLDEAGEPDGFVLLIDGEGRKAPAAGVKVRWQAWVPDDGSLSDVTNGLDAGGASAGTLAPVDAEEFAEEPVLSGLGYGGGEPLKELNGAVTTDARGGFHLDAFPEGASYAVEVRADDTYRAARTDGVAFDWRATGEPLTLVRVPHGTLQGRTVDLDGRPLAGVTVRALDRRGEERFVAVSGRDGGFGFVLDVSRARVEAELTGHVSVGSRDAVPLDEGGWAFQEVVLARAGTLEVDLGPAGDSKAERWVGVITSLDQFHAAHRSHRPGKNRAKADARGRLRLTGLPVGQELVLMTDPMDRIHAYRRGAAAVSVPAGHRGPAPDGAEPIVIPESGRLRLTLHDVHFTTVTGRVLAESESPMADVRVNAYAEYRSGGPMGSLLAQAVTAEDGRFSMTVLSHGTPGLALIKAGRDGPAALVDLGTVAASDLVLKASKGEELVGRVEFLDAEASLARVDLRLVLLDPSSEAGSSRAVYEHEVGIQSAQGAAADGSPSRGAFRLEPPVPGRYRLVARHPDHAPVAEEFDFPRSEPVVLRFGSRYDAEVTVRVETESGSELDFAFIALQSLPAGTSGDPLRLEYHAPGGAISLERRLIPSTAFQSRFPGLSVPESVLVLDGTKGVTRRLPSGPAWIGALGVLRGQDERPLSTTGPVLVPEGASEVTLTLRPPLKVRGRLSAELLAKGADLYLRVRPAGASMDLDVGRGPLGVASPFVRLDRRGRFDFAVPRGVYECRVHSAAGALLKTVQLRVPLSEDEGLVIE